MKGRPRSRSSRYAMLAVFGFMGLPTQSMASEFEYAPPGQLVPGSGQGRADDTIYAPGMRFPMESGPAYPNSQVYGHGGAFGPGGGQCHENNYSYPWYDNYCETRSWTMPLCPSGTGHQGQDIRPATCENNVHWEVAAEAGTVTHIGSFSIHVTAPDGTRFEYLHGASVSVSVGQAVEKGQRLSKTSNQFGGNATTIHLHLNIRQDVGGFGSVYVPPYTSLIASYKELMGYSVDPPGGPVDAIDCESVRGWAFNPRDPDAPVEVEVWFGGQAGDPAATGVTIVADEHRDDLCDVIDSCPHGFTLEIPRSLRDEQAHEVHVYAVDEGNAERVALEASPGQFQCAPPAVPAGVRRKIASPEVIADFQFSLFWDLAKLSSSDLEALPLGEPWPEHRVVVQSEEGGELWLVDRGVRRAISPEAAQAWNIEVADAFTWPHESVMGVPMGPPVRSSVFLVSASGEGVYVIDDPVCPPDAVDCEGLPEGGGVGGSGDDDTDGAFPGADTDADGEGGCGCRAAPRPSHALLVLALFGLYARRRRR